MTGYSRVTRQSPLGAVTVELRGTNHRYLEIDQRVQDGLSGFGGEISQLIKRHLLRGHVDVIVSVQPPKSGARRLFFDEQFARSYYEALVELKDRFGLKGDVTLDHLLSNPRVLNTKDENIKREELWPVVQQGLEAALRALIAFRRAEGGRLIKDIKQQMNIIARNVAAIRKHLPRGIAAQKQRLGERFKTLTSGASITPSHVHEALLLLKEVDVNEELVRLESHLTHMEQTLKVQQQSVGKKLDFISQELQREANTLGAKANDGIIVRYCIEIKGAIEKIREQAQNLE